MDFPGAGTKKHRPLSLPLPSLTQQIIAAVPVIEGAAGFVFTTTGRTPVSGFSRAKQQLNAAMKSAGHVVPEFRLHDLKTHGGNRDGRPRRCVAGD